MRHLLIEMTLKRVLEAFVANRSIKASLLLNHDSKTEPPRSGPVYLHTPCCLRTHGKGRPFCLRALLAACPRGTRHEAVKGRNR